MKRVKKLPLMLVIMFTSVTASAENSDYEYEIGVGINSIHIDWLGETEFNTDMLTIEGTAWNPDAIFGLDVGLRAQYGQSTSGDNINNHSVYEESEATIDELASLQAVVRGAINQRMSWEFGLGAINYGQSINSPTDGEYSENISGYMWSMGAIAQFNESWSMRIGYNAYHDKNYDEDKSGHDLDGDSYERTSSIGITLNYKF